MDSTTKAVLMHFWKDLTQLRSEDIIDFLISEEVLSIDNYEEIRECGPTQRERMRTLLELTIRSTRPNAFEIFLQALKAHNMYSSLANMMQEKSHAQLEPLTVNAGHANLDMVTRKTFLPDGSVGFQIQKMTPGSSAANCGQLDIGDFITAVNGRSCMELSKESFHYELNKYTNTNHITTLSIKRKGSSANQRIRVVFKCAANRKKGIVLERFADDSAIYIAKLEAGSPASEAGHLRIGDTVVKINGEPVNHLSLGQVKRLLGKQSHVAELTVQRQQFMEELIVGLRSM